MSYAAIRDAIEARLNTLPDIGVVNDYRRAITTWEAFQPAFMATISSVQQVRGWDIAWESGDYQPAGWQADGTMRMRGPQTYVVRGYMALNDSQATDKTFSALIRDVIEALATCKAALEPRESHVPVTLRMNGYLTFDVPTQGGVTVHHSEIAVRVLDDEVA